MLNIMSSRAIAPSKGMKLVERKSGEDNIEWLARNLTAESGTSLVLVGGKSLTSFRLRVAQAHVRHDLVPSYWSHVMLLGKPAKRLASTPVYEISLEPSGGFGFPPPTNGVQTGRLSQYAEAEDYPNIALLNVPVVQSEVMEALKQFQMQRAVLDAVDLLVTWLSFIWGTGRSGNPLLENHGIPSAAILEVVFAAVGYDLTPGMESRSSCPEAIWQAAKWWHEYYEKQNRDSLTGAYHIGHALE